MNTIIKKAFKTHSLDPEELVVLLSNSCFDKEICAAADTVRKKYVGDEVHLRGLIEFSNICSRNCYYCGLRCENKKIHRYRLEQQEILEIAKNAKALDYKTVVLQSGEGSAYSIEELKSVVSSLKELNLAITLSIGEKTFEEYKILKKAGADRFLLRIETTDKALYERYHPNMSFKNRVECLKNLRHSGYEVGTGCLVGLPEQSVESLANDILFFKEINADMIGIGPFIPNKDTPLKDAVGGTFEMAIKVMALTRLLLPDINIPATTAMETLHPQGRILALKSGANVVMPNVTEGECRKFYELYPGKIALHNTALQSKKAVVSMIESIGRCVGSGYGFHKKKI